MNKNIDTIEFKSPKPRLTLFGAGIVLFVALLYNLFYSAVLSNAEALPFLIAFTGTAVSTALKVILLFTAWFFIVRQLHESSGWIKLGLHLLAGFAFVLCWYYGYLFLFDLAFGLGNLEGGGFMENRNWVMFSTYFEYAITFSVIHVIDSLKKLRVREQQAAELRELSNRQQIANLKAQLNPHFLFNTLNSINAMVSKDVDQTRSMIARLSEMLRYSLQSFEKERVSLSDELSFVQKYLELEKHRLGDRLYYSINIDEELKNVEIPPMIIQPIVENAVKHGITPAENGGAVDIAVIRNGENMIVSVKDTGSGISDPAELESSNGIGIRNTNEHLKKRYGNNSKLQFDSTDSNGTRVWFAIPLSK